jgi:ATP-dependent DNA ligase
MWLNIQATFKVGERIIFSPDLGASRETYYKWVRVAAAEGLVEKRADGAYYRLR